MRILALGLALAASVPLLAEDPKPKPDPKDSVVALMEKAKQGDADAQVKIGDMHAYGQGVPKDEMTAVKWYRKAAESGNAQGRTNLGIMYAQGRGIPNDDAEAFKWFERAAKQGNAGAQYNLGILYYRSRVAGVRSQDGPYEAFPWFERAAKQGNAGAQHYLGTMYAKGYGVTKNQVLGYKWLVLAAAHGIPDARRDMNIVQMKLSPSDLALGQRLAMEFRVAEERDDAARDAGKNDPRPPTTRASKVDEAEASVKQLPATTAAPQAPIQIHVLPPRRSNSRSRIGLSP